MQCPACQTANQTGQKYCGACGHKLEKDCTQCGMTNPLDFSFCGACGHNLSTSGTISLLRSGLIAEIEYKAAYLLGHPQEEISGKPFSLFVAREDLAVFFSHWNELLSSGVKQCVELALKHKKGKRIYVLAECVLDHSPEPHAQLVHLHLKDVSDRRLALDQLQHQQDLLHLIFSIADQVHNVTGTHLDSAITGVLKKTCLFTKADRCFIYGINRNRKRLEISHHWSQPSRMRDMAKSTAVPLIMIKRCVVRLRREHMYIANDISMIPPAERYELLAWHHADLGALMCHLVYSHKRPVGIIGVARNQTGDKWPDDAVALVKLLGQFLGRFLPWDAVGANSVEEGIRQGLDAAGSQKVLKENIPASVQKPVKKRRPIEHPLADAQRMPTSGPTISTTVKPLPDMGKPMQLARLSADQTMEKQTVFPRDDGVIVLTCPFCGIQEAVSQARFEKLGNAIRVQCSCHKRFAAILEKRRAYRKSVRLEGYFTITGEFGASDTKGSIWGPMVVKNISKSGLRFISKRIDLIRPGEHLMVRFNLDNSNNALIHKQVQVVSIHGHEVGCKFKGADQYDITLGFYFI